ncbi:MAG: hypothetical protein Q8T11_09935 [Elusimicrobiota bacterium]|nr:hypothetical protein [Elusimicrobiota bacterium]
MINLILTLSLSSFNAAPAAQTAQFRPCVWPNVCKTAPAPVTVAQFRPCVWPNVCRVAPATQTAPVVEVAQFTTCVYPRKCGKKA